MTNSSPSKTLFGPMWCRRQGLGAGRLHNRKVTYSGNYWHSLLAVNSVSPTNIMESRFVTSSTQELLIPDPNKSTSVAFIENTRPRECSIRKETPHILEQEVWVGQAGKMAPSLMYSPDLNVSSPLRPVQWSSIPQVVGELGYRYWLLYEWKETDTFR